jgi:hypothetical protein
VDQQFFISEDSAATCLQMIPCADGLSLLWSDGTIETFEIQGGSIDRVLSVPPVSTPLTIGSDLELFQSSNTLLGYSWISDKSGGLALVDCDESCVGLDLPSPVTAVRYF